MSLIFSGFVVSHDRQPVKRKKLAISSKDDNHPKARDFSFYVDKRGGDRLRVWASACTKSEARAKVKEVHPNAIKITSL